MFKVIARDLSYVGLLLVVDAATRKRAWASTAIFTPNRMIYGSGSTPDAALESLIAIALAEDLPLPFEANVPLEPIAGDLLQLVVRRSDLTLNTSSPWTGTGKFRRKWLLGQPRIYVVTAPEPDEVLEELLLQVKGNDRR